jgi:hypothetical protein
MPILGGNNFYGAKSAAIDAAKQRNLSIDKLDASAPEPSASAIGASSSSPDAWRRSADRTDDGRSRLPVGTGLPDALAKVPSQSDLPTFGEWLT